VRLREEEGQRDLVARFHADVDAAYAESDERRREQLFREKLTSWFRTLELDLPLRGAMACDATLASRLEIHVRAPAPREKEGGGLRRRRSEGEGPPYLLSLRVEAERFLEPERLAALAHHHLALAAEMISCPERTDRPLDGALVSGESLLWNVRAAGRIARSRRPLMQSRDGWLAQFREALPDLPDQEIETLFHGLWDGTCAVADARGRVTGFLGAVGVQRIQEASRVPTTPFPMGRWDPV